MIRVFWVVVQIVCIAVAAIWVFNRPGTVDVRWLGYDISANTGVAFLALVATIFLVMSVYKILGLVFSLPRRWRERHSKKRRDRGYRSLALGLSAVAAGDAKLAGYHAYRMRRAMPDEKGLPWLLEAQSARLRGNELEAQGYFEKLLKDKDTSFLGVRGLLSAAMETADLDRALSLARQALEMHPEQPWILRTVFGLETQKREWASALKTLKIGERHKVWSEEELRSNRVALFIQQSDELTRAGYAGEALKNLKQAQRLDPAFVPTAIRLAQIYADDQKRRNAISVIERAWKDNPHPALVPVWEKLSPPNKPNDMTVHLRWFERLVALKPGDAESQMAAANAAIQDGLWGEAWQYLAAAEKIRPNARLYRLWAQMEEKTNHGESARRYWEKAASAAPDKVWTCRETGRIYERWSAIAEPHGAFNTIIWDYPRGQMGDAGSVALMKSANDLIIEPVRAITGRA